MATFARNAMSYRAVFCQAILCAFGLTPLSCAIEPRDTGASEQLQRAKSDIIYGTDNRVDYKDISDPRYQHFGDATAALFSSIQCAGGTCSFPNLTQFTSGTNGSGVSHPLCSDVRFRNQKAGVGCSSFLVGPDTFVTAGHCLCHQLNTGVCSCLDGGVGNTLSVVFDFNVDASGNTPTSVPSSDVYTCTGTPVGFWGDGADWAVFKVDRTVANRTPLIAQYSGALAHDELVMYGYDLGLPLKFRNSTFVKVDDPTSTSFSANADMFPGDSGGPVLDSISGVAVGINFGGQVPIFVDAPDGMGGTCEEYFSCADDGTGCPDSIWTAHTRMTYATQQGHVPLHSALVSPVSTVALM